jgi:hypothetical protein
LVESGGWSGLWIEGSPEMALAAKERYAQTTAEVLESFVTRDNILGLLQQAGVPQDLDLLSIDIDGNDYWIWERIATEYSPRVVVIEYNASMPPGIEWVMPYRADHVWDRTNRFGASLDALDRLGERLGYALVGCDSIGVNAFFVRNDLVRDRFSEAGRGSAYHYVSPKYNALHFGHPPYSQS